MHMPKLRKTSPYIKSPLNYTGGKFRLLPQLLPHFPDNADVFVDLFCGGASVGLNVRAERVILNDIDSHVTGILEMFRNMPPKDIVTAVEKHCCRIRSLRQRRKRLRPLRLQRLRRPRFL